MRDNSSKLQEMGRFCVLLMVAESQTGILLILIDL